MGLRGWGYSLVGVMIGLAGAAIGAQSSVNSVDAHLKAAEAAAGPEYNDMFHQLCDASLPVPPRAGQPAAGRGGAGRGAGGGAGRGPQATPDPATWHAEPVKVFDNLYWFGQTEYSVWAVTTSAGIIVVDTIYGYAVEDEVVGGMKKMGLDPATIKYAIVSHGHADHSGGARYLQEHFGTRVIMSPADWDLLETSPEPKPKRDLIATDGQKLTLGDTTLTMYITPGHTKGTISTLIPVKDHGTPHTAAIWGGTLFNWARGGGGYITPETPASYWYEIYSTSARRFRDIITNAKVDILLSNHTAFDGSKTKLPAVLARKVGDPNPYVIGNDSVKRYLTMADECAKVGLLRSTMPPPQ
jgi:metallo-beta-lactamase class B